MMLSTKILFSKPGISEAGVYLIKPDDIERAVNPKTLLSLLMSVIVLMLAVVLWQLCKRASVKYLSNLTREKRSIIHMVICVIKYLLIGGTILLILQMNGVNVSSAVAGLGITSAIVGLALQDILKDVIMGVNIITESFFELGDVVEYQGIEGVVIGFSVRTTKIKSIYDQSVMTICNRNISEIRKCSSMVDIDIPLSYNENIEKVHKIMQGISEKIAAIDGIDSSIYKGTERFEESAVIYKLRFFCVPENKPDMRRAAMKIVQEELENSGMKVPYKQLDVHIDR